jgi:hypothetical protein
MRVRPSRYYPIDTGIQFTLRSEMKRRGRGVRHPFRKKPDENLTTEMALVWFDGVMTTALRMPGTDWMRRTTRLSEHALDVLQLLGIDEAVFSRPPPRQKMELVGG